MDDIYSRESNYYKSLPLSFVECNTLNHKVHHTSSEHQSYHVQNSIEKGDPALHFSATSNAFDSKDSSLNGVSSTTAEPEDGTSTGILKCSGIKRLIDGSPSNNMALSDSCNSKESRKQSSGQKSVTFDPTYFSYGGESLSKDLTQSNVMEDSVNSAAELTLEIGSDERKSLQLSDMSCNEATSPLFSNAAKKMREELSSQDNFYASGQSQATKHTPITIKFDVATGGSDELTEDLPAFMNEDSRKFLSYVEKTGPLLGRRSNRSSGPLRKPKNPITPTVKQVSDEIGSS